MAAVLMVSKAVEPPWNDSNRNLVRDLAGAMVRHDPVVLGVRGGAYSLPRGRLDPVYSSVRPTRRDQAKVLRRLLTGTRGDLWHFFFAPNRLTTAVARGASAVRRVPTVHTVCSVPRAIDGAASLLFADRTVVLSRHTERLLLDAGLAEARVRRIPPAVAAFDVPGGDAVRRTRERLGLSSGPILTYPGDLEFGSGASIALDAFGTLGHDTATLVMACRAKTSRAPEIERLLQTRAAEMGISDRVAWVGETNAIHDLLGASDIVLLPSESLYAKMDYPLVLLEAMAMGKCVLVANGTPAEELASAGGAVACDAAAAAVALSVGRLLSSGTERGRVGEAGRALVRSRFSLSQMASQYEDLYDDLLLAKGGVHG